MKDDIHIYLVNEAHLHDLGNRDCSCRPFFEAADQQSWIGAAEPVIVVHNRRRRHGIAHQFWSLTCLS